MTDKLTGYGAGRCMPDAEMLCSVADYFHVTVDFLTRLFGGGFTVVLLGNLDKRDT
ncbi:hypothetical protein [[Clostridium] scindens]|uniref:hypothetical protein n=1 Tax=Clostridium scindens (strain JCM 10418 / VPI 12708) TaxID=29347 RepID=UPI00241EC4D5|nr:hypothetical protein [[Clostridium] scindens]